MGLPAGKSKLALDSAVQFGRLRSDRSLTGLPAPDKLGSFTRRGLDEHQADRHRSIGGSLC